MYAIIEVGGKQYRAEKGQSLLVDRLPEQEGAKVSPRALLYRSDETVFDGPGLAKVKVDAKVLEHLKGEKIRVFKYRPKKGYRRTAGHRSLLTRIEIVDIKAGVPARAPAKPAAKPAVEKPKPAVAKPKPAAKKPAVKKPAAKKPAAKKAAAKKPAAKKPATKKPAAKKPAARKPAPKKES